MKTALVTGAASGIGLAITEALHTSGYAVVLLDVDEKAGEKHAARLGAHARFLRLDVTEESGWQQVIDTLLAEGATLQLLVNNAGIGTLASIEDTSLELWNSIQQVNATGVFLGCKFATTYLERNGNSSIINIASALGVKPMSFTSAYCASKAAAISLTKTTALHCAQQGYGIRCNAVLPGFIETPLLVAGLAASADPVGERAAIEALHPVGHIGTVTDVARMVCYLADESAEFITGACFSVDGGMTL